MKTAIAQGTQAAPGLAWVIRTRWAAASAQAAAVLVAAYGYGMGLPVGPLLGLVGVTVATNLALAVRLRGRREAPSGLLGGALLLDTAVLTVMLHLSGGAANPFSALYLVYIALAAVLLGSGWAWTLVVTAVLAYVGLFLVEPVAVPELSGGHGPGECPLHDDAGHAHHGEAGAFDLHLYGMWIAFSVSACLIAFFVTRTAAALDARERQLAQAREQVARTERLAGLTTLAAGSAHELGTPLGTIAVVAKELERGAAQVAGAEQLAEDARVIREQVARCRGILDRMAVQAGESAGEMPTRMRVEALVERARALLTPAQAGRVRVSVADGAGGADLPVEAMTQVLASLLRNALDASPEGAPVEVLVGGDVEAVWMEVRDRGHGMDEAVRLRATEPFFTTKEAGAGMGLGLFLAQTVVERLGGSLALEGREGGGTVARVRVPRHVGGAGASASKGA